MNFVKKHQVKQAILLSAMALTWPAMAVASLTPAEQTALDATTSYETCLTEFAAKKSGQNNDWCYIEHSQFINSAKTAPRKYTGSWSNTGRPLIHSPAPSNPTVHIDQGHNNFHKIDGDYSRYLPFKTLLNNDGYNVAKFEDDATTPTVDEGKFTYKGINGVTTGTLDNVKILVIANPVHFSDNPEDNWVSPIESAYTPEEIEALDAWVKAGGSLMLIADHFPFPGAVDALAKRFGFAMDNGYHFDPSYNDVFLSMLLDTDLAKRIMRQDVKTSDPSPNGGEITNKKTGVTKARTIKDDLVDEVRIVMVALGARVNSLVFWAGEQPSTEKGLSEGDGWLADHPIIRGLKTNDHAIPYVTSFTGQSFQYQAPNNIDFTEFTPLMKLGKGTYNLLTTAQDAYFGPDSSASESELVSKALSEQRVPAYTADYKATYACKTDTTTKVETCSYDFYQGAALKVKSGKVVVFGEAGMFTAQIAADQQSRMGFNHPMASHNQQFVLNTIHWLDGVLTTDTDSDTTPTNTGLETPSLIADTVEIARLAKASKDDRIARDAGIIDGEKSYAAQYNESYDGTDSFGCSLNQNSNVKDPTLLLLLMFALGYIFIPRKQRAV
jgi:hypothetical protein